MQEEKKTKHSRLLMIALAIVIFVGLVVIVLNSTPAKELLLEISTEASIEGENANEKKSDEAGYYVVWDDFTFKGPSSYTDAVFSSWDTALPQGAPVKAVDGASFADGSIYAKAQALRAFNAISDDFTMEFTMRMSEGMDNTVIALKNDDTTAIRFTAVNDKLYVGDTEICDISVDSLKHFKLHISPANSTYTVSVDGTTVRDGDTAKEFTFENSTDAIDRLYIETGVEETGQIVIGTVRVYAKYYINEKFLDGTNLAINDEWTVTGDAATIYKKGTQGPDKYNVLLEDGEGISRDVAYEKDGAWVEFQQLMEEKQGEFAMILSDEAGNEFKVATVNGKFGYYNGDEFVGLYDCLNNMWYHVMLKQTDEGTEIYLNHKLKADKLPNIKFTNIAFTAEGGEAMLDDIVVKDWMPLPDDYVPEPVAVEKEEGASLVGLQSCNLWVEGEHFGYDWLTDWEERTPVLGYYDEISVESADWELKFKIEHGIDFELYCWFRTLDGYGEPIKTTLNARALHEGYMNAEYSDQMNFAITWESGNGGGTDLQEFKDNIVPYWIEQYFKDDRYMKIDNKPLIGMYNIGALKSYFGGTSEGVKEAMDYLRQECVDAGFEGAYIIMCNNSASSAAEIAQVGFDGQYAYTWGTTSYTAATQTKGMTSVQNALEAAEQTKNGVIPTVSQGLWNRAWNLNDGKFASVETFQSVLQWVKDEFHPSLNQDSIGSKMVLLDNWNEYCEGHFIMPANLAGFGYLDAVKTVFGDGEDCDETVQHVIPTEAQLARINHMYIQDRHVVLVDKDGATSSLVPMEGYNWTFDVDNDAEGWTLGTNSGVYIKDLKESAVKNGNFYGFTFTPDELSVKQQNGDFGNITGKATADPCLVSPDNLGLNASSAISIKIRMRAEDGFRNIGSPGIYFITETDKLFSESKFIRGSYEEGSDGYAEMIFDMTTNTYWTGTIKQLRFDPIEGDGKFWIDSIQVLRKEDSGDFEVYLDGDKVYTDEPVKMVDGEYLFPVDELSGFGDIYVSEPFEKDRLYIYTDTAFYEFPYEGDNKLLVDGKPVDSVGLVTINDTLYVPIVDIFKNIGTVTGYSGETYPAYTVEVKDATAAEKVKIEINKFADPSVLLGYNFNTSKGGWGYGGYDATSSTSLDGLGAFTISANGPDICAWSPIDLNVDATKADQIRLRLKVVGAAEGSTICVIVYGDGMTLRQDYNVRLTEDILAEDGYYEVALDLTNVAGIAGSSEIDRACIKWYDETTGGDQIFYMDSFEILDLVEGGVKEGLYGDDTDAWPSCDTIYASLVEGWHFNTAGDEGGFGFGGGPTHYAARGLLTLTGGGTGFTSIWSPKQLNIATSKADTIRIRINTDVEYPEMTLNVKYVNTKDGTSKWFKKEISYAMDDTGWAIITVDLSDLLYHAAGYVIAEFGIYPLGEEEDTAKTGTVNIDYIEVLRKAKTVVTGNNAGAWTKNNKIYASLAKGYYFATVGNEEGFGFGGGAKHMATRNLLILTGGGTGFTSIWSPKQLNIFTSNADTIRIRINTDVEYPEMTLKVKYINKKDGTSKWFIKNISYTVDGAGWAMVAVDLSESEYHTDDYIIEQFGIFPLGEEEDVAKTGTVNIDYIEFLKKYLFGDDKGAWAEGDKTYASLEKGYYFNSDGVSEGLAFGGNIKLSVARDLLTVTGNDDYVRFWNKDGLNIATSKADTIRIRINTDVEHPEMTLNVKYTKSDDIETFKWVKKEISYAMDDTGWAIITVDLSDLLYHTEDYVIDQFILYPLGEKDAAKTGTANIDYIEFLMKAEEVVLSGYYFTADIENWGFGGTWLGSAATSWENGALKRSANAASASLWSPTLSNVDASEADQILLRVKVDGATEGSTVIVQVKVADGETPGWKPYRVPLTEDILAEDGYYEVKLDLTGINTGTINQIAITQWYDETEGAEETQTFYMDSCEIWSLIDGDNEGSWAVGDTTYASLAKGYYFQTAGDKEGFGFGGGAKHTATRDLLIVTGGGTDAASIWSPKTLNIATADADTIRIRINTEVANPEMRLNVKYTKSDDSETSSWFTKDISYTTDEAGWAVVTVDLSKSEYHTEDYVINELGLCPLGVNTDAAKTGTAYIDYIEVLKKAGSDTDGGNTDEEVLSGYYFTANIENWAFGGTWLGSAATSWENGALKRSANAAGASLWSPTLSNVDASEADQILLRVKVDGATEGSTVIVQVKVADGETPGWKPYSVQLTEDILAEDGYYEVKLDLTEVNSGTINQIAITQWYDETEGAEETQTFYMDSCEIWSTADSDSDSDTDGGNTDEEVLSGYYFTADIENWGFGGTWLGSAATSWENGALKRSANAAGASLWSPTLSNVDASEADQILLRVKVDGATEGSTVIVQVKVADGETPGWKPYSVQLTEDILAEDGYYEVKLDLTEVNSGTINQIAITQWYDETEGAEETQTFYMDSCEIWSTADSDSDSDTDGGNTDEEVLSGYYFTADIENWAFGGTWLGSAATSWENGALKRSANAAGASLWSPTLSNVDASEADYVLLRVKVDGATEGSTVIVQVNVADGETSVWKPYSVQLTEDILAEDGYYEVKLDLTEVNSGTINQIAITQWYDETEGAEETQTFYMDSCEIWSTADSDSDSDTDGGNTDEEVLSGYYFTADIENWAFGGTWLGSAATSWENGALKRSANAAGASLWSPTLSNVDASEADQILLRVKVDGATEGSTVIVQVKVADGETPGWKPYSVQLTEDILAEDGYYEVKLDLTEVNSGTINQIAITQWYDETEGAEETQTFYMDSCEIWSTADSDSDSDTDGGNTDEEVLSGYYFTADIENWGFGGTWLGSAATSWENGALKRSANAAGASLWSPTLSNVDASEADQILLRVKVDGATEGSTVIVQVKVADGETPGWKPYSVQLTEDILAEDGYYEVKLDLTEVNSGTINQIAITQWYDETEGAEETQTFYMDSCEIWGTADSDSDSDTDGGNTDEEVLSGYYFTADIENWAFGGTWLGSGATSWENGALKRSANAAGATLWSPILSNVDASEADQILLRVKVEGATKGSTVNVAVQVESEWKYYSVQLTEDILATDGYYEVKLDLTEVNSGTISKIGITQWYDATEGAETTQTFYMDSCEILGLADSDSDSDTDGGNTDEEVLSGYYFTADIENWGFGGTWLGSAATSWENGALKRSANAAGASLWSPTLSNVDASEAGYVLLRVKVDGATEGSTVKVAVEVESEWKYYSVQLTEDILAEDGYYDVNLDLTEVNSGTISKIGITQWYDETEGAEETQTFYMDSCEIWSTADNDTE